MLCELVVMKRRCPRRDTRRTSAIPRQFIVKPKTKQPSIPCGLNSFSTMAQLDDLFKELVPFGVFGLAKFAYLKANSNNGNDDYPDIVYYDLGLEQGDIPRTYHLAVKLQQREERIRKLKETDKLYSNEVAMYRVILPFLKADHLSPKYFFGRATLGVDAKEDILIFEDVRTLGFTKPKGPNLLYQEMSLALTQLGKFHGFSYKSKRMHSHMFYCLTGMLQSVIPGDDQWDAAMRGALERGIRPLMGKPGERTLLQQVVNRLHDPRKVIKSLHSPSEPFAVIHHGDFHKENLLFNYNEKGIPTDCLFVDFQMSFYSDPIIDISSLLYMNATPDDIEKHWDDFLKIYWNGVTSIEPDPGFTYEQFLDHFSRKAIYGYIPSSLYVTRTHTKDPQSHSMECLAMLLPDDRARKIANMGGAEGTTALTKIVKHLFDRGYIERFVQSDF